MLDRAQTYFRDKKILITGGSGFIGSHLAHRLSQWKASIRLFDCHRAPHNSEHEFILGDVRDYKSLERATQKCDIVFHLAALLGVEKTLNSPKEVMDVNLQGTVNALKAAEQSNVSCFVFASSSEIYGEPRQVPVNENTPPSPVSVYGISKLAAEAYCRAYSHATDLKTVRLRFFNVYGPGQTEDFVVPRFVGRIARGEPPIIYGAGDQVRAYTYVSDAVDCMLVASSHPNGINEVFNVGSRQAFTVAQLANLISEISGNHLTPEYRAFGNGIRPAKREIYNRIPDTSKAEKLLGFSACTTLYEGIVRCYEWNLSRIAGRGNTILAGETLRYVGLSSK